MIANVENITDHGTAPVVCPLTGRKFFMWVRQGRRGYVPTYGGPYDSWTIPAPDSGGEPGRMLTDRYDHDEGCWVETESWTPAA